MSVPLALFSSLLATALAVLPVPVPVVHVTATGSDVVGDGSLGNPYRTVQRGVDAVDPGGTVRVGPGSYPTGFSIPKAVTIEGFGGRPTLGPLASPGALGFVLADDVSFEGLDLVGSSVQVGVRVAGGVDRTQFVDCTFTGFGSAGLELIAAGGGGFRIESCRFESNRNGGTSSTAILGSGLSSCRIESCEILDGDFGIRMTSCAALEIVDTTLRDLRQSALLTVACPGLVCSGSRVTRCGWIPTPGSWALPADELGAVTLGAGCSASVLADLVVEDSGGFVGFGDYLPGTSQAFDGLFAVAVRDSANVRLERCTLRNNPFGGVHAVGASNGLRLEDCNLIGNGGGNRSSPDLAVFTDGPSVDALGCFWGLASGPLSDGPGPGNAFGGVGSVALVGLATLPFQAPSFRYELVAATAPGPMPRAIVAADLDGDGSAGVVTAHAAPGRLVVQLRSGSSFLAPTILPFAGDPTALVAGYLDADPHVDLAVADAANDRVIILYGDGTGGFPRTGSHPVLRRPVRIGLGDLVPGAPGTDLAVACQGDVFRAGGLVLLDSDGAGNVSSSTLAGTTAPCDVLFAETDGSPGMELIAYDLDPASPGVRFWRSRGDGTFDPVSTLVSDAAPVSDARLASFEDSPGLAGLGVATFSLAPVLANQLRLIRNDGVGGLLPPQLIDTGVGPLVLASAAFGGGLGQGLAYARPHDGRVVAYGDFALGVGATITHAEVLPETGLTLGLVSGDLHADPRPEWLVLDAATGTIRVWRRQQPGETALYGNGCIGGAVGTIPDIRASSIPTLRSRTFSLGLVGGPPNAAAFALFGITSQDMPVFGSCRLLVEFPFDLVTTADASGDAFLELPVPLDRNLVGNDLFAQWWVVAPPGLGLGSIRASRGLRIRVGG